MLGREYTRREFLKQSAVLTAGISLLPSPLRAASPEATVVRTADPRVWRDRLKLDPAMVQEMLSRAMVQFTGEKVPKNAWRRLFGSRDVVGIKVNTLAGRVLSSNVELVDAITQGLLSAGVRAENIIIWDRFDRELRKARFQLNRRGNGIRCYGTENQYSSNLVIQGEAASCYSQILYDCTHLINVPVLKHHSIAGVSVSLKNWFGAIHNPNKYHSDRCNPFVADVSAAPILRQKKQLIICDALLAQYEHGPGYKAAYCWTPNQILVSDDPVALDTIGWQMIEEQRQQQGLPSLKEVEKLPDYLATAADDRHALGVHDMTKIRVVDV